MILLILFERLPFPLNTFFFYFIIFIVSLLLIKPAVFLEKTNKYVFFFGFFFVFWDVVGIYHLYDDFYNYSWLFNKELLPIFVSTLLFAYFLINKNIFDLIIVTRFVLVFILITAFTSIVGLMVFPDAAREMTGMLAANEEFGLIEFYKKIGIAGYDFYYGLAFAMPIFVLLIKIHWHHNIERYTLIFFVIVILYVIIKAQMTTALLFSVIGILFSIAKIKNKRTTIIIILAFLGLAMFVPNQFYADNIRSVTSYIPGEILQTRLLDLSETLEKNDKDIENMDTHVSRRSERIPFLLNQFYHSPITGGGESTSHVFWLDRLSLFGMLGWLPWILLLASIIKTVIKNINKEFIYYYVLTIILFIGIGFMKNSGGKLLYLSVFFIVPSILLIYSNNRSIFKSN